MKNATLTILTSPGCSHCESFLNWWENESVKWPNVTKDEVSVLTPEGQALVSKYQIFTSPGIIINDELIGFGGFNPKEIQDHLKHVCG